jgi:hypothetical protein
MDKRNSVIAVLLGFMILFAALSVSEFLQTSEMRGQVSSLESKTATTITELGAETTLEVSGSLGQSGVIVIEGVGDFNDEAVNYSIRNSLVFDGVNFSFLPNVAALEPCVRVGVTTQNGSNYSWTPCFLDSTNASITFASSSDQVGLLFMSDGTAYVLVRTQGA